MSEPLSRDELENWVLDLSHVALRKTALHYLDRVAELEKERDGWIALANQERLDFIDAEAGLAAAQEALNCEHNRRSEGEEPEVWGYAEHEGKTWNHCKVCGLLELWEGGTFFGVSLALARGGGQQETG